MFIKVWRAVPLNLYCMCRATIVSLEDFEGRLNQAIERNAFLESELDEKESLLVSVQRLKDEARGKVKTQESIQPFCRRYVNCVRASRGALHESDSVFCRPETGVGGTGADYRQDVGTQLTHLRHWQDGFCSPGLFIPPSHTYRKGHRAPLHQPKRSGFINLTFLLHVWNGKFNDLCTNIGLCARAALTNGCGSSSLTPSARISALNIVGDLLRKVGVGIIHFAYLFSLLKTSGAFKFWIEEQCVLSHRTNGCLLWA